MTVRDLFDRVDTMSRSVTIYDADEEVAYKKSAGKPISRLSLWDRSVAWIYRIDASEIVIRMDTAQM